MRRLLPLPVTVIASPAPGAGTSPRVSAERFGNAQAGTIEQREDGGVARQDPGRALLAVAQIGVGHALGGGDGQRLRQAARHFRRTHGIDAPRSLPLPLRSRKRAKERMPASERMSERLPMPPARRAAMKARRSAGDKLGELSKRRRAAEMLRQEGHELRHVAAIGFERLERHAPFGAEMGEPVTDRGADIGARGDAWLVNIGRLPAVCPPPVFDPAA